MGESFENRENIFDFQLSRWRSSAGGITVLDVLANLVTLYLI